MIIKLLFKYIFITAILLVMTLHQNVFSDIKSEVEKTISDVAGSGANIVFLKYTLPEQAKRAIENQIQQKFFGDYVYLWLICDSDSISGFAILDNVYGKSMPITFLTIFDYSGSITLVDIIRYREPFGGAIASRNWLDQFIGKNSEDNFTFGKNIDSITGATISVGSVTKGIKKLTILSQYILQDPLYTCLNTESITETVTK
jgi:Na+-translocating ferredoxin:NAD+ oxidoreductase RnfG subunit